MAKLKWPSFDDGTLLQRTLLYVATFVFGSVGFIAIASFLVVTAAKALVPSRSDSSASASATDKVAELAPAPTGKSPSKRSRPNKGKTAAVADEAPPVVEEVR
jgi:hypothetical protein